MAEDRPKRKRRRRKKKLPPDVSVHLATADDIMDLVNLIVESHKDDGFKQMPPVDMEALSEIFAQAIAAGLVLIARKSMGRAVGLVAMIAFPLFYNPSHRIASTWSWYVSPLDRSTGVGAELIRRAEKLAKDLGCIGLVVATRHDQPGAKQCIRNLGFDEREAHCYKEL